jgi:hypothetical protein
MPPPRQDILRFPRGRMAGLVLSDDDHAFLVSVIGPCHGPEVDDVLVAAPAVSGGRRIDINHPVIEDLLSAIGAEVHGYMKLDEERDGRARTKPRRGSTAERLQELYQRIEDHLS